MGLGVDAVAEVGVEHGLAGTLEHEEMGKTPGFDDGTGDRGIGPSVGEGLCGGSEAGEVFPVVGGDGGDAGVIPEIGGEVGWSEQRGGVGIGRGVGGGQCRTELGRQGTALEREEGRGIEGGSVEVGRERGKIAPKGDGQRDEEGR